MDELNSSTPQGQDSTNHRAQRSEDSSQSTNRPVAQKSNKPHQCLAHSYANPPRPKWWQRIDWSQVVLDTLLLIVGIRLACIYSGQLKAMLDSNKISRESLTSVQRAFIVPHEVQQRRSILHSPADEHAVWYFTMPWENTGTTPANITSQAFFEDKLAAEPTEEQFIKKPLMQNALVGPKAVRNVGNVTLTEINLFGQELPHQNKEIIAMPIQTLTAEDGRLYVFWGWVTYNDAFPNTPLRITEFCQALTAIVVVRDTPQTPFGFAWVPCDHHNCADEHCDDYQRIVDLSTKK